MFLIPLLVAASAPAPREGVIIVNGFQPNPPAVVLTPDGKEVGRVEVGGAAYVLKPGGQPRCPLSDGRLSPDGKRLVATRLGPLLRNNGGPWTEQHLWVFDLDSKDGPQEALLADVRMPSALWSPDGSKLYGSYIDPDKTLGPREDGKPPPLVSWVHDFRTKKRTALDLPVGHQIVDVSPDGKSLLTTVFDAFDPHSVRSYVVPLDTLKPKPLTEGALHAMRFSPDGKSVIGKQYGKKDDKPPAFLAVVAVTDGTSRRVPVPDEALWVDRACWSPDGKRIAFSWYEEVPGTPRDFAGRVTVADADGRNPKTIVRRGTGEYVRGLDWK